MSTQRRQLPTNRPNRPKFQVDYNNFANMGDIQNFINKQLWVTGSTFQSQAGNTITTKVNWGGQSRFLLGFNFYANNPTAHQLTINLNQELIVENTPLIFFQPLGNLRFIQYFEFIRPLSGSDTLTFTVNSTVAEDIGYGVYMTRDYNRYYVRD